MFRPDPTIFDGRFANNGWLQELPKPMTKLTWDNAAIVSPATADRWLSRRIGSTGGEHGTVYADMVELSYDGRRVRGAAWILPGQADDCVTVHLGYGRTRAGRVGTTPASTPILFAPRMRHWHGVGLQIRKTGEQHPLACTQFHHLMEGRAAAAQRHARRIPQEPKLRSGDGKARRSAGRVSIRDSSTRATRGAWPSISTSCIGCNACVVACDAENNIPVVGKEQVLRGREMHWLRIDRYYEGDAGQSGDVSSAGAVHALRERAVRGGLPGRMRRRTATKG